jgi:hypothetical protein
MNVATSPTALRVSSALLLLSASVACATGRSPAAAGGARPASAAAPERPRLYPVTEPLAFARAVDRGTRTRSGRPGPRYWQQEADYTLRAELDPASKRLTGSGTIRYRNRSPDTLRLVAVYLNQNLFAPDAIRSEFTPVTGGMTLGRVAAQGQELAPQAAASDTTPGRYVVEGTVAWLRLPRPLPPGGDADLAFDWSFVVPPDGAPRMGTDGEIFYLAYWYPQLAVYDDVHGWATDQYRGNAEFYMGYGDYDVSLTLPAGWLVAATGELQNADAVLAPQTRARLADARRTGSVVHVVAEGDRGAGRATLAGQGGKLTWRFRAADVRDFAWGASDRYLWDATHALARDSAGRSAVDTVMIHSFYRPERVQWAWDQSARYGRHSIEFLSRYLWPYPYPQMTAVDGVVSCSGMEYPMMTCIGGRRDTLSLYSVTVHEIAHMWFPMQVGSNERRYAWQDEGLTRFNQAQAMREFFNGYDLERIARNQYLALARRGGEYEGGEVELMRHGDLYPPGTPAYGIASYAKMATNLAALRALLGDETFLRAYREYGRRWVNKHPQPYDMWNTFDEVSGQDLSWFWRTWFYDTWTLDHAVAEVREAGDSVAVVVEDRGRAPMPARLVVTREGGTTQRLEVPVSVWLGGARRHTLHVAARPRVTRVEIDPEERFPDIDRSNNRWGAEAAGAGR